MILDIPVMFLSVVIPIFFSLLLPFIGGKKVLTAISTVLLLIPTAVILALSAMTGLREPVLDPVFLSNPGLGNFSMLLDSISAPVASYIWEFGLLSTGG